MKKLSIYCGLNGVEAIKDRKTRKTVFISKRSKSKLFLKSYPKTNSKEV